MITKLIELPKLKIILIVILFLTVLIGARLLFLSSHQFPDYPHPVQGVLDLRDYELKNNKTISLDGEWEFYPNQLIAPNKIKALNSEKNYMEIPKLWEDEKISYQYGTYRLRILVNDKLQSYGIRAPVVRSASQLFVNEQLLNKVGQVSEKVENYIPKKVPYSSIFTVDGNEIDIVIHVANADFTGKGGINQTISFGKGAAIERDKWVSIMIQLMVCIVLLIHVLYAWLLYVIGIRQKTVISFFFLILSTVISVLIDDDRLMFAFIPINWEWATKIYILSYTGTAIFLVQFVKHLFPKYTKLRILRWFVQLCGVYMLIVLLAPAQLLTRTAIPLPYITLVSSLGIVVLILRAALKEEEDNIFLLLSATAVACNLTWGVAKNLGGFQMPYYPFDVLASILALAAFWFKRYFQTSIKMELLSKKLQKADKLKDDFLANTSHELRNPLHGIMNIAQTILTNEGSTLNEKNKKDLELLITIGEHMSFTLNDLLDLTQLKEKNIQLQIKSLQIQTIAAGVFDMLRFMTDSKPVQLVLHIPDSFPSVAADENRLIQILFNLVHNAIKFTNEGKITIRAEVKKKHAYIHIEDTGVGIDEATQKRIFHPYEQGDSSITAIGGGIGLGLSICRQLVKLHGGSLKVASIVGQGSVFTFTLPLSNQVDEEEPVFSEDRISKSIAHEASLALHTLTYQETAIDARQDSAISTSNPNILAVDDDPINLKILVNVLSTEQYHITTATNGREALAKVKSKNWDLIITDIMMPHMSGYELSRLIRERYTISELPILFLTARSQREDIYTAFLSGANDYVTKPLKSLELKARVRALINLKQSIEERLRIEAAWLQAQIQPHFFFNTLSAIMMFSETDKTKMKALLEAFSDYLQTSFDFQNAERIVPIEYELDLVRSYLSITEVRFGDRVQIVWEVDKDIQLSLPPLSIQPLVENAIHHGILKRGKGGVIRIRIAEHASHFEIAISDDGVGMDKDALSSQHLKRRGIGLANTDQRLKQLYGKGLNIQSNPDHGTTVSFVIPK
ncbi:ATP-binding protein [Bacillus chungangensis]|uniref:histidine kinase n=1 Tax=Bacillus chungangensis TaxID=587633 RepID=A0ABT9WTG1_9BACI|nr:ATP-binding protein [Bacillus chungangensis]MDQ0176578.1 sensor histidine kinase YesM [Bacillus chungangensis]